MSVATDRYREMAKDYLITKDMVLTYGKFHPKIISRHSLEQSASRLLSNVNFLRIKEEVAKEIEPDLENKIEECLQVLYNLSHIAKKESDRIIAGTNYLKFTMGEKHRATFTDERKAELLGFATRLGITQDIAKG